MMNTLTEAHRPYLDHVLDDLRAAARQTDRTQPWEILHVCADLTISGVPELKPEVILSKLWPSAAPDSVAIQNFREVFSRLREQLDNYYDNGGNLDPYRLVVDESDYSVKIRHKRSFPEHLSEGATSRQIDPRVFSQFLRNMCDSGPLTRPQRNLQVRLCMEERNLPVLVAAEDEFESLLAQLSSWEGDNHLSFVDMRSLCRYLSIHEIMLDPLLAEQVQEDCIVTELPQFIIPPDNREYGKFARYAVSPQQHAGTDAQLVYVTLEPGGKSDTHQHPGDELLLPLDGSVALHLHESGVRIRLERGQVAHFHSEQTHTVVNLSATEPAFLFIVRFYQMDRSGTAGRYSRQEMRREIRRNFPAEDMAIAPWTRGWILQALAARGEETENKANQIRDQRGLARLIRLLGPPQKDPGMLLAYASRAHPRRGGPQVNYGTLDALLDDMDTKDLTLTDGFLLELRNLFPEVYGLLLVRFLFPGISGVIVFRPDDDEDTATVPPFASQIVGLSEGQIQSIPVRNLTCGDIMLSHLTLKPKAGTPVNRHPGYELLVPLQGEAYVQFDRKDSGPKYLVSAHKQTIAHYRSTREHRVWNDTNQEAKMIVLRSYGEQSAPVSLTSR